VKLVIVKRVHSIDGIENEIIPSWDEIRNARNTLLKMTEIFLRDLPQNYSSEIEAADALNDYDFPDIIFE
jgi:hypothetical protein